MRVQTAPDPLLVEVPERIDTARLVLLSSRAGSAPR